MKKPKRGNRYLNYKGEYCIVKSIYKNILKIQITGKNARTEVWKLKDFLDEKPIQFWEVPYPKITRVNIARHLLEYQLNMIGKTTYDSKQEENWFKKWTINDREYEFFKNYAISQLRKTFKINKKKAESIFNWFNMQFGLKRKNNVYK